MEILKLIEQINTIKQNLECQILNLPINNKINRINNNCFTINSKDLEDNILCPYYYDFRKQYKFIVKKLNKCEIENFVPSLKEMIKTEKVKVDNTYYRLNPKVVQYLEEIL